MAFEDGPYVQAACFCDLVIEDKSGVLSLIRVIDTLTHTEAGPTPPDDMPPVPYSMKLVLMLKAGLARGRYNLKVVPEKPTGGTENPVVLTAYFDGEEKGQNVVINVNFTFTIEGLYWFNVYLDDQKLTAMPFRTKYNRLVTGTTAS